MKTNVQFHITQDIEGVYIQGNLDGHPVSSLLASYGDGEVILENIQVDADFRRRRIGSTMLNILTKLSGNMIIKGQLLPQGKEISSEGLSKFYAESGFLSEPVYRSDIYYRG